MAQQRLYEAQAEVEARYLNAEILILLSLKPIHNMNHVDRSCVRRFIRSLGDLIVKNRFYQEHHAKKNVKKYRNYEEFGVTKWIESDSWEVNLLCRRKRILDCESASVEQLWNVLHSQSTRWNFWVPEEWLAAVHVSCTLHENRWVLQDRFFIEDPCAPERPSPSFFKIPRNSTSSFANWDQVTPKVPWDMKKDWDENRRVQQYRIHDFQGILTPGTLCIVQ